MFLEQTSTSSAGLLKQTDDSSFRYEDAHDAMGTTFDVVAYGPDDEHLASVINEVFDEVDRLDQQMSKYRRDSEVSHINRTASRHDVIVEPRLFRLIQDSILASIETEGAFDITIGPLMKSWGFYRQEGRVPSLAEIERVLQSIGYQHIKLDPSLRMIWFDEKEVELDLGAIAKGYAIDHAVSILRSHGVTSALLSSGSSSIYALGAPPHERAWQITLRDPFDANQGADIILLKNCSVSTSGNYVRFFTLNGKTYSHIINPLTGWPVEGMLSTAVVSQETTESEALSTALYTMGLERASRVLATHPNLKVIYYLPTLPPVKFERVVARSSSYDLPPEVLAEIKKP